ncbi:helix-turn-helix domain-containing protein [Providencia sp. Me31A]|uniref:helix-turn-helix domain-containing protein n=1 Tax=Providencia sp. Me31A TaxID=3392637 RepID=UPI003D2A1B2E
MKNNPINYISIGNRLRAYRIAESLRAEQVAENLGISRAAVYRLEKGEIVKIETLEKLADLLNTSLSSLLGVSSEYYSNADGFFERMRQLEDSSEKIYAHFEPFSYLLTSKNYDTYLAKMLMDSAPKGLLSEKQRSTLSILEERKNTINSRPPRLFNLISLQSIQRILHTGLVGSLNLPPSTKIDRILQARNELIHLINIIEGKQHLANIAISIKTIPSLTFQIFYNQQGASSLAVSPFRLGEFPNITNGIASVTNSEEAISRYRHLFDNLWEHAAKGEDAINLLKRTLDDY